MGFFDTFLPEKDRHAAILLYGMVLSTCKHLRPYCLSKRVWVARLTFGIAHCTGFNGYDAGIMTVILADDQFTEYYGINADRQGIVATIPWATTGKQMICILLSACS